MVFVFQPWQLLLAILAGWSNRQQQDIIAYLRTENQVLKEKLGKRRIVLTDDQRRRLALKGKVLGRKACGHKGDVIDLWAALHGLSLRAAGLELVQTFHLEPAPRTGTGKRNG